ncbi:MAG: HAD family hydrolase [Candidatus Micrarchaeia archaeon]
MVIKAIIFDVGGVLIDFSEEKYISWLSNKLNIDYKKIDNAILPLIDKMEMGRLKLEKAEKIFSKKLNIHPKSLMWVEGFSENASPNVQVIKILEKLSKSYKIGVITNVSFSRYYESRKLVLNSLLSKGCVKTIISSCYFGVRKPNHKIYEEALKKLNVKAEETVFIDNQIENVEGAAKLGIHALLYTTAKKLEKDLRSLDIKIN